MTARTEHVPYRSLDPWVGAMVQLADRERGRHLDPGLVGEALAGKGIPSKDPPPSFSSRGESPQRSFTRR